MGKTHFSDVRKGTIFVVSLHRGSQLTGSVNGLFGFRMPFPAELVEASARARAKGGTITAFTIDVLDDGVSALSAAMDLDAVAAGTVAAANISSPTVADDSIITADVVLTGTAPTADDIDLFLTFRMNDSS